MKASSRTSATTFVFIFALSQAAKDQQAVIDRQHEATRTVIGSIQNDLLDHLSKLESSQHISFGTSD